MAGPSPDVNYTPFPQAEPTVAAPNDYLSVRATPDSFGAQVGAAKIQQGQALEKTSSDAIDIGIQRQGMLNETMATNADTQLAAEHGKILGAYKSMEGLQAVSNTDKTVSAIQQARLNIRATLPNAAAQRAFDLFAARREAYTVGDINNYSATQLKQADTKSAQDALQTTIDQASGPSAAFDDSQIDFGIGEVKSQIPRILTNMGYGQDAGTGMKQDANGDLSFDDSEAGKQAKAVADQYTSKAIGAYWDNILKTQSTDNEKGSSQVAINTLNKFKDEIPTETYAKWSAQLNAGFRAEQIHSGVDAQMKGITSGYQGSLTQPPVNTTGPLGADPAKTVSTLFPGATVTSEARSTEHNAAVGGVPDSLHLSGQAIDFVLPKGMTFAQVQQKLEDEGIKPTELLNEGNHVHLGWGQKSSAPGLSPVNYQTQASYVRANYADELQKTRDWAESVHPGDADFADKAVAYKDQQMSKIITQQTLQDRNNEDTVMRAISGDKTHPPITSVDDLENNFDPAVKSAWQSVQAHNGILTNQIQTKLLSANSRGAEATYGTDFYTHLSDALSGKVTNPNNFIASIIPGDKTSTLTNTGYSALSKEMQNINTPEGKAFAQQELAYINNLRSQMTSTIPGKATPKLDAKFNSALQQILPLIQNGRASGKTPGQLFNVDSPDFVGKSIAMPSVKEMNAEVSASQLHSIITPNVLLGNGATAPKASVRLDDLKDKASVVAELQRRIDSHQITKNDGNKYLEQRGFRAPSVPLPQ